MLHRINLYPWRQQRRFKYRQRFWLLLASCLVVVVISQVSIAIYIEGEKNQQYQRLAFLDAHISSLDVQLQELAGLETQHQALLTQLKVGEELQAQRNKTTELMNLIPVLIPEGVYVDKIKMTGQVIEVSGISDTTSHLAMMLERLENSQQVKEVVMHSIVHNKIRFGKKFQDFRVSFTFVMREPQTQERQGG